MIPLPKGHNTFSPGHDDTCLMSPYLWSCVIIQKSSKGPCMVLEDVSIVSLFQSRTRTHTHAYTHRHTHTQSLMPRAIFLLARGLLWTPHKTASECTRSTWNTSLIRGGLLSSAWVLLYSHSRCFINQFFPSCAFRNKQTRKTRNLRRWWRFFFLSLIAIQV